MTLNPINVKFKDFQGNDQDYVVLLDLGRYDSEGDAYVAEVLGSFSQTVLSTSLVTE